MADYDILRYKVARCGFFDRATDLQKPNNQDFIYITKGTTMSKQELHPRTAVLNKNQKNQSRKLRSEALTWLAAHFPEAFDNSLCIRPLKAGIMGDILSYAEDAAAAGISKSKLREAVVLFTRRLDYLACLKLREPRIDLHGNPVVEVSAEEAEHAALKIKKRVEKSARNARKLALSKTTTTTGYPQASTHTKANVPGITDSDDHFPVYPIRTNAYQPPNTHIPTAKVASVTVKHKSTRQYDPDAVARLKEKLGLSRTAEEKKEAVE